LTYKLSQLNFKPNNPELSQTRVVKQVIKVKRYSYLRVTAIQIDVHPAGEYPINTIYTLPTSVHVRPAYASYGQSPYEASFHESSTELSRTTALEKKGS
jgi:hypothetical protein